MNPVHFLSGVFLRSPYFSHAEYTPEKIGQIAADPDFQQAIYFASPSFYRILAAKKFNFAEMSAKEKLSLAKYYNRMCFRPTPFGNFSTFTLSSWGSAKQISLSAESQFHIQPDQEVAISIGRYLGDNNEEELFITNPTLYKFGKEFRFIRSVNGPGETKLYFSLESIDVNPLTSGVTNFARHISRSTEDIKNHIQLVNECTWEEAGAGLAMMKEAQVLQSGSNCNISGKNYLERLIESPDQATLFTKAALPQTFNCAKQMNHPIIQDVIKNEETLCDFLNDRNLKVPGKMFYCNTEREQLGGSLDNAYQEKLHTAISCLQLLIPPVQPDLLATFITDFNIRFEGRQIPLLKALDPDYGIGYGNFAENVLAAGLLEDITFIAKKNKVKELQWSASHTLLMQKWLSETEPGKPVILNQKDLNTLPKTETTNLPASMAVMFRIIDGQILIENIGGPTATCLVGRFTPLSASVRDLGLEIAENEQKNNPGVLFAEIGQLSDDHVDNINKRQTLYPYEIPINSVSLLDSDHQIHPADLMVSVQAGKIILESVRHQAIVIPRLSSAYNFQHNQLSLFRFLCDLQYQGLHSSLGLEMEYFFPGMSYYPRVQFQDIILTPAKWHITQEDSKAWFNKKDEAALASLKQYRLQKMIPAVIAFTNADQQLVFNLENEAEALLFMQVTSTLQHFTIQEFFIPAHENSEIVQHDGKPLINQFIAFLVNDKKIYDNASITGPKPVLQRKKDFIIGTDWLYLKIYCNPISSNSLLVKKILPVIKEIADETPTIWFFIRYADPKTHIRLRVKIKDAKTGPVIALFKKRFAGLVQDNIVREYQADTYRRELHRYGADIIEVVEEFFYASSEMVCRYIRNNDNPEADQSRYLAICTMETMLSTAIPLVADQVNFLESVKDAFSTEYTIEKAMRIELDNKYRVMKKEFMELTGEAGYYCRKMKLSDTHLLFTTKLNQVLKRSENFAPQRKTELLTDLIHMHLNRVFTDQQRRQEFVLYYCFHKLKLSALAQMNHKKNVFV